MAARAVDQGHAVRHEGAVGRRLPSYRRPARLLRRLRSVWRLRPAIRRRAAEPQDRRPADPLSRTHLRHDEHPALAPRLAPATDGPVRRPPHQIRLIALFGSIRSRAATDPCQDARAARVLLAPPSGQATGVAYKTQPSRATVAGS